MSDVINIRDIFVPTRPGYCFVDADWSQVENRLSAILAGERFLLDAFARKEDIYKKVYSQMFGVPMEKISKSQRQVGKQLVLGQNYGMSASGLAERLECSVEEAEHYVAQYWDTHHYTRDAKERLVQFARENGFVRTYFGRIRYIRNLDSRQGWERGAAEREVWNTFIQGTAADILKIALVRLHKAFAEQKLPARIVLPIHDEILVEADICACDIWVVAQTMKTAMEIPISNSATKETIVLPAEADFGWRFGSLGSFETLTETAPDARLRERLQMSLYWKPAPETKPEPEAPAPVPVTVKEPEPAVATETDFQKPALLLSLDRRTLTLPGDFFQEYAAAMLAADAEFSFYIVVQGTSREVYKAPKPVGRRFGVYLKANGFRVDELFSV